MLDDGSAIASWVEFANGRSQFEGASRSPQGSAQRRPTSRARAASAATRDDTIRRRIDPGVDGDRGRASK